MKNENKIGMINDNIKKPVGNGQSNSQKMTSTGRSLFRRYRAVVVAGLIGLALSLTTFFIMKNLETERQEFNFIRLAEARCSSLKLEVKYFMQGLHSVRRFYDGSQFVSRDEFAEFVAPVLVNHPYIRALDWVPRVAEAERAAFEQTIQAEGLADFRIFNGCPLEDPVVTAHREEYYPVLYRYPPFDKAVGWDMLSLPLRAEAIRQARDMGVSVVTGQVVCLKEGAGVIIFEPIYKKGLPAATVEERRAAIEGVAVCAADISSLFKYALNEFEPSGLDVAMIDLSNSEDNQLIYQRWSRMRNLEAGDSLFEIDNSSNLLYVSSVDVANRTWKLRCTPSPENYTIHNIWIHWIILLGGLALTILLVIYLHAKQNRTAIIETLVDERTAQLRKSEGKYRELADSLPQIVFETDIEGRLTYANRNAFEEYGYSQTDFDNGLLASNMISPEDRKRVGEKFREALHGNKSEGKEYTALRKDGSTFPIIVHSRVIIQDGRPIGLRGIIINITERKRVEKALQKSEEKYRNLVEKAGIGILIDNCAGDFIYFNKTFTTIFGYTIEEMKKLTFNSLVYPEFLEKGLAEHRDRCHRKLSTSHYEFKGIKKDGTKLFLEVEMVALKEGDRITGWRSYVRDITERKRAEKALKESEERFRAVFETAQDSIFIKDRALKYVLVNPAMERLFGKPSSELIGKTDDELFGSEAGKHIRETDSRVLNGDIIKEEHAKPVDGISHTFSTIKVPMRDSSGEIEGICGIARDITEIKLVEREIRKFKAISDSASHGVSIADANGNIEYINECFAKMHGYEVEELIGQNLTVFHTEKQLESVIEINEELKRKGSYGSLEVWHKHKDGSEFPTLMNGVAIKDKNGEILFMAGMASDLTEIKRLRDLESRAQRLETAGQIAGQVAHDFNNMLAPLMAYPEMIRDELPKDHPALAYLRDIEKSAARIAEMNQQLLTLGRRGYYKQEPLNLNEIVLYAVKELESLPDTLAFEINLAEDLMNIFGGNAQIYRVITNLLHNARDAMQDIGQITIRTENYYVDDVAIVYGRVPKGEYVKLTISDAGCGIPDDIIQKIFDPFFTSKTTDKKRGSGLGLSVVDAVIKDHKGYLDLSSKIGHGTSFYLYFPITRESIVNQESDYSIGGSESVLIVDDDEVQCNVSSRILKKLGYKVSVADSGEKAIEFLKENPQDLIALDMIMPPGMDGTETYRRILEINPNQKAIIVSGFSETERVLEVQKLGAGAFIKKPITMKAIAAVVRDELNRKAKVAESLSYSQA